jgi:hypothetical protein
LASKKPRKAWNQKLKSETLKAEMQTSKRPFRSRGFWIVLAVALCISIGVLIGFHGGLHNEAGAVYDSGAGRHAIAGREEIRLYGAFVLLAIVGVIALATLALFVGGIFPPRRKHHRSAPPSKV